MLNKDIGPFNASNSRQMILLEIFYARPRNVLSCVEVHACYILRCSWYVANAVLTRVVVKNEGV